MLTRTLSRQAAADPLHHGQSILGRQWRRLFRRHEAVEELIPQSVAPGEHMRVVVEGPGTIEDFWVVAAVAAAFHDGLYI